MQRGHEYKYARCATLAGARVEWIDDIVRRALETRPAAAILHPAHLDGVPARCALDALAPLARAAGVPVVVDAAFLSFPLSELERWATAADRRVLLGEVLLGAERRRLRRGARGSGRRRRGARLHGLRVRPLADVRARVQARPRDGRRHRRGAGGVDWRSTTTRACAGYATLAERARGALRRASGSARRAQAVHARRAAGRRSGQRGARARRGRAAAAGGRARRRRPERPRDGRRRRARVLHGGPDRGRGRRDRRRRCAAAWESLDDG